MLKVEVVHKTQVTVTTSLCHFDVKVDVQRDAARPATPRMWASHSPLRNTIVTNAVQRGAERVTCEMLRFVARVWRVHSGRCNNEYDKVALSVAACTEAEPAWIRPVAQAEAAFVAAVQSAEDALLNLDAYHDRLVSIAAGAGVAVPAQVETATHLERTVPSADAACHFHAVTLYIECGKLHSILRSKLHDRANELNDLAEARSTYEQCGAFASLRDSVLLMQDVHGAQRTLPGLDVVNINQSMWLAMTDFETDAPALIEGDNTNNGTNHTNQKAVAADRSPAGWTSQQEDSDQEDSLLARVALRIGAGANVGYMYNRFHDTGADNAGMLCELYVLYSLIRMGKENVAAEMQGVNRDIAAWTCNILRADVLRSMLKWTVSQIPDSVMQVVESAILPGDDEDTRREKAITDVFSFMSACVYTQQGHAKSNLPMAMLLDEVIAMCTKDEKAVSVADTVLAMRVLVCTGAVHRQEVHIVSRLYEMYVTGCTAKTHSRLGYIALAVVAELLEQNVIKRTKTDVNGHLVFLEKHCAKMSHGEQRNLVEKIREGLSAIVYIHSMYEQTLTCHAGLYGKADIMRINAHVKEVQRLMHTCWDRLARASEEVDVSFTDFDDTVLDRKRCAAVTERFVMATQRARRKTKRPSTNSN